MNPSASTRKRTPSSLEVPSFASIVPGTVAASQAVHGQLGVFGVTVTVMPAPGLSRLPQSSTARVSSVTLPAVAGVHANVQLAPPCARAQVVPPSTDTSTAATTPPPASAAVPLTVTVVLAGVEPPFSGKP